MNDILITDGDMDGMTVGNPMEENGLKTMRNLTERAYLGEGYIHQFINDTTQEVLYLPCPQAEYESMGGVGGAANNPTLGGHTWQVSIGGTIKVDTPNTLLGEDEFCKKGAEVVAVLSGVKDVYTYQTFPETDIETDGKLDESKIKYE